MFKEIATARIVCARETKEIVESSIVIAKIATGKPRRGITRRGYERRTSVTEERRRKNEMTGIFVIVETMTDTSRRRIMTRIGMLYDKLQCALSNLLFCINRCVSFVS